MLIFTNAQSLNFWNPVENLDEIWKTLQKFCISAVYWNLLLDSPYTQQWMIIVSYIFKTFWIFNPFHLSASSLIHTENLHAVSTFLMRGGDSNYMMEQTQF